MREQNSEEHCWYYGHHFNGISGMPLSWDKPYHHRGRLYDGLVDMHYLKDRINSTDSEGLAIDYRKRML